MDVKTPLPRMTYDEAMERFGHDAPDLRFGMELTDCTELAKEAEFRVFRETAESGGRVRGINAKGAAGQFSRKRLDELTDWVKLDFGAKGLVWFRVEENGTLWSPVSKNFSDTLLAKIGQRLQARTGRPAAVRCRLVGSHLQGPGRLAQTVGRRTEAVRPADHEFLVGRRVSHV